MAVCRGCGQQIEWVKTSNDKLTPVNPDKTSHWATCPDAKSFKRKSPKKGGQ